MVFETELYNIIQTLLAIFGLTIGLAFLVMVIPWPFDKLADMNTSQDEIIEALGDISETLGEIKDKLGKE